MTKPLVLIVDDEPDLCELLKMTLSRMSVDSLFAHNLQTAKNLLRENHFALCLTDMRLPDGDGIELIQFVQALRRDIPVAVITAYGNMEGAVHSLKAGAFDYVSKPVDLSVLRNLVQTALSMSKDTHAIDKKNERTSPCALVGNSLLMTQLRETIKKVARSQAPIFISGESGVGKELVARLIHAEGPRSQKPFVPVNCGAIPAELVESEFFGYKKGSFTGATQDKEGLFQAAHGGTLFLDEIADLPLNMQVKILRAIQEKSVRPVGEQREIPVDVRILSATHKDLSQMVLQGEFRQDLFYRINVIEVKVPNLRERLEDLEILAEHILSVLSKRHRQDKPILSEDSLSLLKAYEFPGNIRELENILERALTLCENKAIAVTDLYLPNQTQRTPLSKKVKKNAESIDVQLNQQERQAIIDALEKTHWNRTQAAKLLGISFRALRYRLKKMGLS